MSVLVRKAQPSQGEVHTDAMLDNISIAYIQSQDAYLFPKVFPIVPVGKQSDKYYTFTKNDWFRDEAKKRADSTESAGSGYGLSSDNYFCDVWAFHKDVGAQTRANADAQIDLARGAVQFVTQRLLLRQELQWVTDYFSAGSGWGTTATPANLWSDYTASDPMEDIETAKETILSTTGFLPNTLVLGYQVMRKLKNHPDFRDRIKYTSAENITPALLGSLLEGPNVYVAKSIKATNFEGESAAYAFAHGKHAWLGYVNPTPGLMMPSAGYTFAWTGVSSTPGATIGIDQFEMKSIKSVRYEGEVAFDNKVVSADLGYFFNGAVA
jgi:hypothetical protein